MAYSQEVADAIVEALARSSLREICQREGMPNRSTVENWMIADAAFSARCARARELHADHIVEGHADIEAGVLDGSIKADAARVVLSSQQWRASKMNQRRYGEKLDANISGTLRVESVTRRVIDKKPDESGN